MNLIPDTPGKTPSYWCTWGMQNFSLVGVTDLLSRTGPAGNLNERLLFEEPGWVTRYFDKIRSDLYILLDAGWDVPAGMDGDKERWRFSPLLPDPARFPSCTGGPIDQLQKLNELCKQNGWRGAGLWGAPQIPGEGKNGYVADLDTAAPYWRERAQWSHVAGIEYWKIDTGVHAASTEYRRLLTTIAREEAPSLLLEHAPVSGPFNDIAVPWSDAPADNAGRYRSRDGVFQRAADFLVFSDILRTYDVTGYLSVATSLDRVAQLLAEGKAEPGARGLINCEDEPYLAAGLGCAMGILRHPLWLPRLNQEYNPAHLDQRIDEVIRAVRWQRLAPAFGANEAKTVLDENILFDSWSYRTGDCWAWWVIGQEIRQGAPATVARNIPLPMVHAEADAPFVVASLHPNGAVAVATLSRTNTEKGIFHPAADVILNICDSAGPIGIFGRYRSLTLLQSAPLGLRRIWAQDLAGQEAVDITDQVSRFREQIVLDGGLIDKIGLSSGTPGDRSEPGLALKFM